MDLLQRQMIHQTYNQQLMQRLYTGSKEIVLIAVDQAIQQQIVITGNSTNSLKETSQEI